MEINLEEILKNVQKGTKLYSTIFGDVYFDSIDNDTSYPIKLKTCDGAISLVSKEGLYHLTYDGECILFPSKENRDWSTFKAEDKKYKVGDYLLNKDINVVCKIISEKGGEYDLESVATDNFYTHYREKESGLDEDYEICEKFPLNTLIPFDRVLVRLRPCSWRCAIFSSITNTGIIKTECCSWEMCVPYNNDTKHLLGTMDDAPEFYRQN